MTMTKRRTIEEATEQIRAKQSVEATAADKRWLRKRKIDLLVRLVAIVIIPCLTLGMFFTTSILQAFMLFGPPLLVVILIEDKLEERYRARHPHPHKWASDARGH
ncbi:hypothetical protein [Lacticaseibacillus mingshuiensis]|nr:hypothetical protein [Lacticaseibacillus mingshuiensis]